VILVRTPAPNGPQSCRANSKAPLWKVTCAGVATVIKVKGIADIRRTSSSEAGLWATQARFSRRITDGIFG